MKSNGDYFGYPPCCIKAFHVMLIKEVKFAQISKERQCVTKKGFIPCQACAEQILRGEKTIEQLILPSRICPRPF